MYYFPNAGAEVASLFPTIDITGASNTLTEEHFHSLLRVENTAPSSLVIPNSSIVEFPEGTPIFVEWGPGGPGQVSLVEGSGVTIVRRETETLDLNGMGSLVLLIYQGNNIWIANGDLLQIPAKLIVVDNFIGGNQSASGTNTNANIGEQQWNCVLDSQTGTWTRLPAELDHPGLGRLAAHPTLGSRESIYLGHAAVNGSVASLDNIEYVEFTLRNVGTGRCRCGLGNDSAAAGLGTATLGVSADSDVLGVWYCFANNTAGGGGSTTVNTTIPSAAGPFITWKIRLTSQTRVDYFADGELVATITGTSIPSFSTLMAPAFQSITITPGPFPGICDIDTFVMQLR